MQSVGHTGCWSSNLQAKQVSACKRMPSPSVPIGLWGFCCLCFCVDIATAMVTLMAIDRAMSMQRQDNLLQWGRLFLGEWESILLVYFDCWFLFFFGFFPGLEWLSELKIKATKATKATTTFNWKQSARDDSSRLSMTRTRHFEDKEETGGCVNSCAKYDFWWSEECCRTLMRQGKSSLREKLLRRQVETHLPVPPVAYTCNASKLPIAYPCLVKHIERKKRQAKIPVLFWIVWHLLSVEELAGISQLEEKTANLLVGSYQATSHWFNEPSVRSRL